MLVPHLAGTAQDHAGWQDITTLLRAGQDTDQKGPQVAERRPPKDWGVAVATSEASCGRVDAHVGARGDG